MLITLFICIIGLALVTSILLWWRRIYLCFHNDGRGTLHWTSCAKWHQTHLNVNHANAFHAINYIIFWMLPRSFIINRVKKLYTNYLILLEYYCHVHVGVNSICSIILRSLHLLTYIIIIEFIHYVLIFIYFFIFIKRLR